MVAGAGFEPTTERFLSLRITVETGLSRAPFSAPRESRLVRTLLEQVAVGTGTPVVIRGEPFWTDRALLAEAGIPTALFGVAGGGAHAASEWVDVKSVESVTRVLEATIAEFCKWP